jgi:hypothetical protein
MWTCYWTLKDTNKNYSTTISPTPLFLQFPLADTNKELDNKTFELFL